MFVRIKLIVLFGYAIQEKITYELDYILTLKRNNDNNVTIRNNAVDAAKIDRKVIFGIFLTSFLAWETS